MKRIQRLSVTVLVLLFGACSLVCVAAAQEKWPDRPVRIVVPFAAGGSTDEAARVFAAQLSAEFHQQFFVENRGGAGGTLGAEEVARSAPDGYTLLFVSASYSASSNPDLYTLRFDPIGGIAPIAQLSAYPLVLVTNPSVPANNVGELIKYAQANPGKLSYGSAGVGGTLHLATELFSQLANIQIVHVPYKGAGPALIDLLTNQIQLMFDEPGFIMPFIKDGRVRAMGMTGRVGQPGAPDLPPLSEYVPGYELNSWFGMMATGGTPKEIIATLSAALERILQHPDIQARLRAGGNEPSYADPDKFGQVISRDIKLWSGVVKTAQIKIN